MDLKEMLAVMAAPIYAGFLDRAIATQSNNDIPGAILIELRKHAITQAHALWLDIVHRYDEEPEAAAAAAARGRAGGGNVSDDHEEMPNYYDMQGGDMLKALGDNGQLWAQAFIQIIDRIGRDKIDEGFMIGWFANAIEHSNAVRRWAREAASALADAPAEKP